MKHVILFLSLTLVILFVACKEGPRRVTIAPGNTGTVVSGLLEGLEDRKQFVTAVEKGRTLRTAQVAEPDSVRLVTVFVYGPDGKLVVTGDEDLSCNNIKAIPVKAAGDYRIEVVQCRKADPWKGEFQLRLTLE